MKENNLPRKIVISYCTAIAFFLFLISLVFFILILQKEVFAEPRPPEKDGELYHLFAGICSPIVLFFTASNVAFTILLITLSFKNFRKNEPKENKWLISLIIINSVILCLSLTVSIFDLVLFVI